MAKTWYFDASCGAGEICTLNVIISYIRMNNNNVAASSLPGINTKM